MSWYLVALRKYFNFSGRSRRREYWYFMLFYAVFFTVLLLVDGITGTWDLESDDGIGLLSALFSLAMLVPTFSVSVRRLHDSGRSGWWVLLAFVPIFGGLILLVFFIQDSQRETNQYGESPKYAAA